MKKAIRRSLFTLCIFCFLSLSFSMQDRGARNTEVYASIAKIQTPASLSPQDMHDNPDVSKILSDREIAGIQLGDYTSTLKGRSILAVNVDSDLRQEIVVDFGALGVYLYDPLRSPKWQRISTKDPVFMIAADRNGDGRYEIYANWGYGNGAEFWEDGVGWSFFNPSTYDYQGFYSADINNDGNEELVVKIRRISDSLYELWIAQWETSDFTWHLIHQGNTLGTQAIAFGDADDELVTNFPDSPGLRCWDYVPSDSDWTDNWTSMAAAWGEMVDCTKAKIDIDPEEEFIVDIYNPHDSEGAWIYNYSSSPKWTRINSNSVYDVRPWPNALGSNDNLVFRMDNVPGLWLYAHLDTPKWTRINGLSPEEDNGFVEVFNYDSDTDWDLAVDFGATGLWKYDYDGTPKWTSMNGGDPRYMIKINLDGDSDDELIVVFESSPTGIWIWDNGSIPKWRRINGANPDL